MRITNVLVSLAVGFGASSLAAQEAASPIYKLPADAGWAEYAWKSLGDGGETKSGTLKISAGKKIADREGPRRWVEFAMISSDPSQTPVWRKMLLDEAVFERDRHPRSAIREALGKQSADSTYAPILPKERDNLVSMGVEGKLRLHPTKSSTKHPLGTFLTQFAESDSSDAGKRFHYRVWLAPDTPFGWARFTMSAKTGGNERPLFEADLAHVSP